MVVELDPGALAEVAIAVWRLDNKAGGGPLRRYIRAVTDALTAAGVETRRYDGTVFDSGLAVRVLAFQQTPDLDAERILETVRPAVYLDDAPIRLGEVIVGIPPVVEREGERR